MCLCFHMTERGFLRHFVPNNPQPARRASCAKFLVFAVSVSKLTSPARRKIFAERRGFEPRKPFWSLHAFQACLFNHSSISPTRFPGVPLQPLEHLSFAPQSAFINIGYKITAFFSYTQVFAHFFRYFIAKSCRALALVSSMTYSTGHLYTCASRSAT